MLYIYRNRNTDHTVELDERSVRLDHLVNWTLVSAPIEEPANPSTPKRPTQSAPKPDWAAYAAQHPDESRRLSTADADAKSKQELIDLFGTD